MACQLIRHFFYAAPFSFTCFFNVQQLERTWDEAGAARKPAVHDIVTPREFSKQRLFRTLTNQKNRQECRFKTYPGLSNPNDGKSTDKAGGHVKQVCLVISSSHPLLQLDWCCMHVQTDNFVRLIMRSCYRYL
jgi:hypothetical protein